MAPHRPDQVSAPPDPVSPAMGELLAEAWRRGALVPASHGEHGAAPQAPSAQAPSAQASTAPSLSGPRPSARVELAGVGESFAAWRVAPTHGHPLIVRIPHVAPEELPQDLTREVAALTALPPGIGPRPVAVHAAPAPGPLGLPYVVTTDVPGTILAPSAWTDAHLRSHAEHLARLHAVPAPGRGPVGLGQERWAAIPAGPQGLLAEVEGEIASWRARHDAVIAEHGLAPLLEAARETVAAAEAQVAQLDGFVLAHGDLCATNILWDGQDEATGRPRVQYIDFEWAQGDDPARDLAAVGGTVHGGPWYVPMDEERVAGFIGAYVRAREEQGEAPDSATDAASLRERMRAWTAYERTAMLVHVASRAATSASHRRVLPVLRDTLAAALGVRL